jgi:hypothetical protein
MRESSNHQRGSSEEAADPAATGAESDESGVTSRVSAGIVWTS